MSYQKHSPNEPKIKKKKKSGKIDLKKIPKLPPVDKNLLIVVLMLVIFGIVAIFSASAPEGVDHYENPLFYPLNHLKFAIVGFVLMFLTSFMRILKDIITFTLFLFIS